MLLLITCKGCGCKSFPPSAERPGHLKFLRKYVSKRAAGKARALLEALELDAATIQACVTANPLNDENTVQDGLIKWIGRKGTEPPTWSVLIEAMEYAEIAQQDITALKEAL